MKFGYDETFEETVLFLSSDEKKLIKSKAKELRKLCYQFGCSDFYTLSDYVADDEEIWQQVANKLGELLPFVKKYWEKLVKEELLLCLLNEIEENIHNVTVSVLVSPLSKDDVCEEMNELDDFEPWKVIETFVKFCDKETIRKVYDYLKQHEDEDEDDEE